MNVFNQWPDVSEWEVGLLKYSIMKRSKIEFWNIADMQQHEFQVGMCFNSNGALMKFHF